MLCDLAQSSKVGLEGPQVGGTDSGGRVRLSLFLLPEASTRQQQPITDQQLDTLQQKYDNTLAMRKRE